MPQDLFEASSAEGVRPTKWPTQVRLVVWSFRDAWRICGVFCLEVAGYEEGAEIAVKAKHEANAAQKEAEDAFVTAEKKHNETQQKLKEFEKDFAKMLTGDEDEGPVVQQVVDSNLSPVVTTEMTERYEELRAAGRWMKLMGGQGSV